MDDKNPPRWYRDPHRRRIGWEIYSWKHFFITVAIGSLEFQINKWLTAV